MAIAGDSEFTEQERDFTGADRDIKGPDHDFIELDGVEKVFDVRKKTGFLRSERDKLKIDVIDLNLNVAGDQDFVFRGTAAFSGIGQIRVVASGTDRIIQFNNDNNMQADFKVLLQDFNTGVLPIDFSHL